MAIDALTKFSAEVMKDAEHNREAELAKIRAKEDERQKAAEADIKSSAKSRVLIEKEKIKREKELEISLLKSGLKKEISDRRDDMFNEVFGGILNNIKEYKNSPQYLQSLTESLEKATEEMAGGEIVCYALSDDIKALSKAVPSLVYKEAEADIIGGFSLENREKHLYLDMTLRSRVENAKKKFYRKSGLVLN